jgi:class 3 adenylate cyclase/tetratricopeptide (TPR) repeat protein
VNCPACGALYQPGSRFCSSCGYTLVNVKDERRIATVLFADLVGFTTFSEAADPEQVKALLDHCFAELCNDVTAFGGRVDKIVGDAIVALFGAPVAHEDDAERAVRAALRMQETLARLRHDEPIDAHLRVGVNTGEVIVGALRAGGDYTALGDAVNTANRLQTAAAPDEILVGPHTHEATRHAIRFEDRGAIAVKGREEPVDTWRAVEAVAPPGQRRRHTRTPLIGRDPEMRLLRSIVDSAVLRSRAHLVVLSGDAGIGKSRLAGEIASYGRQAHDAKVLGGQCVPYGADVWWPIAEAIRGACGLGADGSAPAARKKLTEVVAAASDDCDADEVTRVVNGLLYLLGHVGDLADVDPGRARDDSARSARILFQHIARKKPLVLVLSELQWADELVLHLVERLLVRLRALPFIVVGTALPDARPQALIDAARGNLTMVGVEPLELASVRELASALLGEEVDARLAGALYERSGGNPFFVEELAALLRESPAAAADPLRFLDTGGVPVTLQGLVAARLDALDTEARALLEDCAVVGSSGLPHAAYALGQARGFSPDHRLLRALAERELIDVPDGDSEFAFTSEVIREVAYATITKGDRARRHALLAGWLNERAEIDDTNAHERVAYHYAVATTIVHELGHATDVPDDLESRAVHAIETAALQARNAEMWRSAHRLYDQALAAAGPQTDESVRRRLLLGRARSAAEQREIATARRDVDTVLAAADDESRAHADALTLLADLQTMEGEYADARETIEQAIVAWRVLGDAHGEAEAIRVRGRNSMFGGSMVDSEVDLAQALALYRQAGDRRGEAWALQNLATISFFQGDAPTAEERLGRAEATFRELGDYGGLNWTFAVLAWVRFMQGRRDDAERLALEQLPESETTGNRWVTAILQMLLGNIALWSGRAVTAVERGSAAVVTMEELGDPWGIGQAAAVRIRALAAAGRVSESLAVIDAQITALDRATGDQSDAFAHTTRVQVLTAVGAAEALPAALHLRPPPDRERTAPFSYERRVCLGRALLQAGLVDEAIAELDDATAIFPDLSSGAGAALRCALALAFVAGGRFDDADAHIRGGVSGSYLDELQLDLAAAFLALRRGEADALDRFDALVARMDDSEAALEQVITRIARAHAFAAAGSPRAAEARADADHALASIDVAMPGWETTFRLTAAT